MKANEYYKVVTMDHANLLERLIELFSENGIRYCVIGGQAVNAYTEPVVSLDLVVVVATEQIEEIERLLVEAFTVKWFPHSINVTTEQSDIRVQIQTDPCYTTFVDRANIQEVLGYPLRIASIEDVLRGKIWAFLDPTRRGSKRQKDLADISRLIEAYPKLRTLVPGEILEKLL